MKRILLLDDDELIAVSLSSQLRSVGIEVDSVRDQEQALRMMASGAYDLVLADCFLTGQPDWRMRFLIDRLANESAPAIPVLLTAYLSDELVELARTQGIEHLWDKPQPVTLLCSRIAALLDACGQE